MNLADIQRRRSRYTLASRPQSLVHPTGLGQIIEPAGAPLDVGSMSQALVFGPLLIANALGRGTPQWVRVGMLIVGVGTVAFALYRLWQGQTGGLGDLPRGLGQMTTGPMHKADPRLHRQTLLSTTVAPR